MPARDLALTGVFAVLFVMALRETWIGALLWTWFSLMNPHRMTYSFAFGLPFAQFAAIATLLSILWSKGKVRIPLDLSVLFLVLFVLWTCVTTYFAILPGPSERTLLTVVKIQLMTLVCIASIRKRLHIELFVWVNFLSIGFFGFKGGLFAIATGGSGRVWGPPDSMVESNNTLGLALTMIIPLGYYLYQVTPHKWVRRGLLLGLLLCAIATLATQSRGAFLALAMMAIVMWTRMRSKFLPAVAMVICAIGLWVFMPQSWEDRMRTIQTYEQDTSAMQRINAWETAVNIANDRVTGAGFAVANRDIFIRYAPNPDWVFTAHSIYFQALGEHGWIGLMLFMTLGALSFWNAARLRSLGKRQPETQWVHDLASMVQVSMIGYAVGGAFLSLAYWDMPYNLMVILLACKYWVKEERWREEPLGLFGNSSSVAAAEARAARKAKPSSPQPAQAMRTGP